MPFTSKPSAEHGAKHEPREPFGHRLLPSCIGGVELRLRCEQVGTTLQHRGRLSGMRSRHGHVVAGDADSGCIERLVADQNRDAVPGYGGERFERRYRSARSRSLGLRALDVERRRESDALSCGDETQRFVLGGRDRAQRIELAQRADEREVVRRDVAHDQQANAPRRVFGRARVGRGRCCARAQASRDVEFPRHVDGPLPAFRIRSLGERLLDV
jgi:hypothetical protein